MIDYLDRQDAVERLLDEYALGAHSRTWLAEKIGSLLRITKAEASRNCADLARGYFVENFALNAERWEPGSDYGRGRIDAAELIDRLIKEGR